MNTATHLAFLADLHRSRQAELFVAHYLRTHGADVMLPKTSDAPTVADAPQHSDDGDLYVRYDRTRPWLKCEVRWRGVNFSSPHDWPENYRFFAVLPCQQWDRTTRKPELYCHLSANMTTLCTMNPIELARHWQTRSVRDKHTGILKPHYCVALDDPGLTYINLEAA